MKTSFYFIPLSFLLLCCGCEKAVTFHLDEIDPKLVVEASIENNQPPVVVLSKTMDYFSNINPSILQNSFVHSAEVYVSNGSLTHKLKEYSIDFGNGYSGYYYSIDSANLSSAFVGQLNHQYSLRIITEGKEYTATTIIPNITKRIDSLWWKPAPPGNDSDEVEVMVKVTDRPGLGDYIRYFTKRNNEPFYAGLNSVFDDQVIDGTTYNVQVERGWDRNTDPDDRTSFFIKGDTVTFKLSNIDKATFDFWRTMEYSYSSIGNPFSSPAKVLSNISNGALGYFGGYASQFRTITIPR
ncbi:MAG TPA: DUF4249 domain-containing protein [Chitinophagaceae bacterium]|jgi:hypothetical protein|nr:DUF4249 domain-containing protein [Chitinophagaceae bacterium]